MSKRKVHQQRCRWLYQESHTADKITGRKARPSARLLCWQTGKTHRAKECTPCLLTRTAMCLSSVVAGLEHKQPMTEKEWTKRHGRRTRREP